MKCTNCKQEKEIIWEDKFKGIWIGQKRIKSINLCKSCLEYCLPEEYKKFKECNECHKQFYQKFDWQKMCINCWKNKKENDTKTTSK